MKIYTKTGDGASTGLLGGRVMKTHPQIASIGALDELNAAIGEILSFQQLKDNIRENIKYERGVYGAIEDKLLRIQNELFHLGAWFACVKQPKVYSHCNFFDASKVLELEIDEWEKKIKPLKNFILPGGDPIAAKLFVVRTIVRRCELSFHLCINSPNMMIYLNRLSDWFFVLARYCNKLAGVDEIVWEQS